MSERQLYTVLDGPYFVGLVTAKLESGHALDDLMRTRAAQLVAAAEGRWLVEKRFVEREKVVRLIGRETTCRSQT